MLITGICGLVGSAAATCLLARSAGLSIAGIDNLMRPGSEGSRLGVRLTHGDIRAASDLEELPAPEWIIDAGGRRTYTAGGGIDPAQSLAQLTSRCGARFGPRSPVQDSRERHYTISWIVMDWSDAERDFGWRSAIGIEEPLDGIAAHAPAHPGWLERRGH